jgi:hypothetical protein
MPRRIHDQPIKNDTGKILSVPVMLFLIFHHKRKALDWLIFQKKLFIYKSSSGERRVLQSIITA